MRVWGCAACGATYRAWLSACPRCKGPELKGYDMGKISVFGGVTNVRASGLLPGVADELPVQVVDRADGTVTEVNSEFDQDADPDEIRNPNADTTGQGTDPDDSGKSDDSDDSGKSDDSDDNGKRDNDDGGEDTVDRKNDPPFDPSDYTVAEVKSRLTALDDPEEWDKVINAERLGKNRSSITDLAD